MVLFFFLMIRRPPRSTRTDTLFPYTTLFRSVEAFCSRGMLRAGNVRGDTVCTLTPDASTGAAILPGFPERYRDAYRAQIDHFADVVHGRAEPLVGYADGIAALELAEACQASLRTGTAIQP